MELKEFSDAVYDKVTAKIIGPLDAEEQGGFILFLFEVGNKKRYAKFKFDAPLSHELAATTAARIDDYVMLLNKKD